MGLYIGINKSKYYTDKWYGVEWDVTMATPDMARIGNMILHRQCPITSRMRRCIVRDDRTVVYYLDPMNSALKADGTPADLTGADGQFKVEIPEHYERDEYINTKVRWMFSEYALPGFKFIPRHYVSAVKASMQRSTNKLASVVNFTADYRGGTNNAAWDGTYRSLIGKAATGYSRTNGRIYAANRGAGWVMSIPTTSITWRKLCMAEYATRNIQQAFTNTLTADGFKKGGLGPGVTTASSTEWNNYNTYEPFINVGVTIGLGNASGVVDIVVPDFGGAGISRTFQQCSFHGIEETHGGSWEWWDGYNLWAQTVAEGNKFLLYVRDQTNGLVDNTAVGYDLVGELPRTENYVRELLPGHLFPKVVGGAGSGSTTFWCDYFYTTAASSFGWRAPVVGGLARNGASAGLVCVYSASAAADSYAAIGSRLCCLGA